MHGKGRRGHILVIRHDRQPIVVAGDIHVEIGSRLGSRQARGGAITHRTRAVDDQHLVGVIGIVDHGGGFGIRGQHIAGARFLKLHLQVIGAVGSLRRGLDDQEILLLDKTAPYHQGADAVDVRLEVRVGQTADHRAGGRAVGDQHMRQQFAGGVRRADISLGAGVGHLDIQQRVGTGDAHIHLPALRGAAGNGSHLGDAGIDKALRPIDAAALLVDDKIAAILGHHMIEQPVAGVLVERNGNDRAVAARLGAVIAGPIAADGLVVARHAGADIDGAAVIRGYRAVDRRVANLLLVDIVVRAIRHAAEVFGEVGDGKTLEGRVEVHPGAQGGQRLVERRQVVGRGCLLPQGQHGVHTVLRLGDHAAELFGKVFPPQGGVVAHVVAGDIVVGTPQVSIHLFVERRGNGGQRGGPVVDIIEGQVFHRPGGAFLEPLDFAAIIAVLHTVEQFVPQHLLDRLGGQVTAGKGVHGVGAGTGAAVAAGVGA